MRLKGYPESFEYCLLSTLCNVFDKRVAHSSVIFTLSELIEQPIHEIRSNKLYELEAWLIGHVRALCSSELHILHFSGARIRTVTSWYTTPLSTTIVPFWDKLRPSWTVKTPPLARKVLFFAFFFLCLLASYQSCLFSSSKSTALCIASWLALTSWRRAWFSGVSRTVLFRIALA